MSFTRSSTCQQPGRISSSPCGSGVFLLGAAVPRNASWITPELQVSTSGLCTNRGLIKYFF
jgi:hypothetical protein